MNWALTWPRLLERDVSLAGALELLAALRVEDDGDDAEEGEAGGARLGRSAARQRRYHVATSLSLKMDIDITVPARVKEGTETANTFLTLPWNT